jgi:hypothetical protein
MSTKAIHDALSLLEIYMEEPPSGMSAANAALLNSARAEVEAIERAAKALADDAKGIWPSSSAALNERYKAHRLMWVIDQQEK